MSILALSALAGLSAASLASAHMQLASPFPYNSPLNSATPEADKDYSMTSPLVASGIYPCKGYLGTADQGPRPSWTAGETVSVSLAGTAVHGGGSCQFGLSYDNGDNFFVIKSYMGGCPSVTTAFDVEIPSDAPTGEGVIFSWSWFNKVGNREMYMNCLSADITGTASTALSGPTIMVANADVNACSTTEGTAVVFESPGSNVVYMGEYEGLAIGSGLTSGAGVVGSSCYAPGSVGAGSGSSSGTTTTAAAGSATKTSSKSSTKAATSAAGAATSSAAAAVTSSKSASGFVSSVSTKTNVAGGGNLAVQTGGTTRTGNATFSSAAAGATETGGACTTGAWKCVGSVLTQCAQSTWTSITDCDLQAGTVCSASDPVGCVWPFQVSSRKRSMADHRAKRRLLANYGSH